MLSEIGQSTSSNMTLDLPFNFNRPRIPSWKGKPVWSGAVTSWTVVPIVMTFSLSLERLTLVQAWPWSALGHLPHMRNVKEAEPQPYQ